MPDLRPLTECLDAAQAAINGMSSPAFTYRSGTAAIEQAKATLAEIRRRIVRESLFYPLDDVLDLLGK